MKMLSIAATSVALFTGSIGAVSAENYLLGVAACPPWKTGPSAEVTEKMEAMCEADSSNLSAAFVERGLAKKENVSMLVQKDATVEQLDSALNELASKVESGDRVYVYVAMHGGVIDHKYKGYPVKGEVFAFYTPEAPADYAAAVESQVWLSARDLRDKLSTFALETGAHVVTILEACHSAEAFHDFKHNPELHLDSEGQMAVLFSAQEDEISHFVPDYSGGRFTTDLAQSIRDADEGADLLDVFYSAAKATFEETFEHCSQFDPKIKAALYGSEKEFYNACHQKPSFYDPHGLLTEDIID